MKLIIDIPKAYEKRFSLDRFKAYLHWLGEDAVSNEDMAGEEFVEMLKEAFVHAVPVPFHEGDLIDRSLLYVQTAEWEAKAFLYVRQSKNVEEWLKWETVLKERTAFKSDVANAPAVIKAERKK